MGARVNKCMEAVARANARQPTRFRIRVKPFHHGAKPRWRLRFGPGKGRIKAIGGPAAFGRRIGPAGSPRPRAPARAAPDAGRAGISPQPVGDPPHSSWARGGWRPHPRTPQEGIGPLLAVARPVPQRGASLSPAPQPPRDPTCCRPTDRLSGRRRPFLDRLNLAGRPPAVHLRPALCRWLCAGRKKLRESESLPQTFKHEVFSPPKSLHPRVPFRFLHQPHSN
jgi:hypothetical protein